MSAEQVLGRCLIVCRRPIARVILKVGRIGIRKIGCVSENVVVHRRQIVAGGKHVVQVVIVVAAVVLVWLVLIGIVGIIGIVVVLIAVILTIVILTIVLVILVLVVVPAVVTAVVTPITPAVSKISKIVAHGTSNDSCFEGSPVSTCTWRKNESPGSFGVCEKQRSSPSGFALHGPARFAATRLLSHQPAHSRFI